MKRGRRAAAELRKRDRKPERPATPLRCRHGAALLLFIQWAAAPHGSGAVTAREGSGGSRGPTVAGGGGCDTMPCMADTAAELLPCAAGRPRLEVVQTWIPVTDAELKALNGDEQGLEA